MRFTPHPPHHASSTLQLANVLSTEALFYTCIIPFIIFFGSFAFVLYPLRDVLHPTGAWHSSCYSQLQNQQQQQQQGRLLGCAAVCCQGAQQQQQHWKSSLLGHAPAACDVSFGEQIHEGAPPALLGLSSVCYVVCTGGL